MTVEFWTSGAGVPVANARQARRAEEAGFDGITYVDSQNLAGDCYIALALAAHATTRLKLGTGVTNSGTRHPAVTACAIATVQAESGGRAYLGIGRGDSALAHLGRAPDKVRVFEDYLERVQGYLSGEEVPFEAGGNVDSLELADQPTASKIEWLRTGQPKVPVDVAATGPRVIAAAARHADRVSFALGADPERIRWGIDVAQAARQDAGLDNKIDFAAYVPIVVHDDPDIARQIGEGGLSLFARFSVMHGEVIGPATDEQRAVFERIHDSYDMNQHSRTGSPQAAELTTSFAQEFGIFGPPSYCIDRIAKLVELGIDRFFCVGPGPGSGSAEAVEAAERLSNEVMPTFRTSGN
ncbi:MAG TPA: LLM class flavin-dependent oxidoreductase [Dehalococcoidia bacterium]|nr:LLM class flavin-dependent oxidoreductase [Dehalococcoidia bacterium]